MKILHICPPHQLDVPTLPWESQKSHFSAILFIYLRLFTLPQKKINSNCCAAALAVHLLLFSASYYLHSPIVLCLRHAIWGARAFIRTIGRVAACGSGLLRHGLNFSTAWCTMRPISVEKDWKHVSVQKVTVQLPHITTGSFQCHGWLPMSGFFSESPAFERTQQTLSQMKKFCNLQVSPVAFKVRWICGWQLVFFWDNVNNQKYVWIILLKMTFWDFPR